MKVHKIQRGAKKKAGLSLLVVFVMSTILNITMQLTAAPTAHAYDHATDVKRRWLDYFAQCLTTNNLDYDGKDWDGNNDNVEFQSTKEIFKKGERIAVDLDMEPENGVRTCYTIALHALPLLGWTETGDALENKLQHSIWGRSINGVPPSGNNGKAIKVSTSIDQDDDIYRVTPDSVKNNAAALRNKVLKKEQEYTSSGKDMKTTILNRFLPLFTICFDEKTLSTESTGTSEYAEGSLSYPGRKIFARIRDFDWNSPIVTSVIKKGFRPNSGVGVTAAEIGDIELDWYVGYKTPHFNPASSHWWPVGNDMDFISNGPHTLFEGQFIASCGIFKDYNRYFFGQSNDTSAKYYIKDGKIKIGTDANNDGTIDDSESVDPEPTVIPSTGAEDGDTQSAICQIQGALGWVLNPICDIAIKSTWTLGGYIENALRVEPLAQTNSSDVSGVYEAWKLFRDLANSLLVLVFLIAIFAQVLPIELDPYMVKKILPKLIAAAIGIQASFLICQILVDMTNVVGGGVDGLVQAAINSLPAASISSSNTNVASLMFTGIAGAAITVFFIGPVLLLLLSGLISILTMLVTIQARQMILIFLAILSPLAILAWVLPNTESYAKKWGQNYIKLLLMYPMIAFILKGSTLAHAVMSSATTSSSTTSDATTIQQIMINIIPIIGFFMIPATFKASGAIMGAISSKGFGMSKGLTGKAKTEAKNINAERGATLMSSESRMKRAFGRGMTGNVWFGDKQKRKIRSAINKNYAEVSEGIKDEYQNMSNSERYAKFQELKKSRSAKDQLKATALGDMIAANAGGPEMAQYFDELEGYDKDGNEMAGFKTVTNADGSTTRGAVTRNKDGSVRSVDDKIWSEISKRNGAFLASAVPHSISKPISAAGAAALISNKSKGSARQLKTQVDNLRSTMADPGASAQDKADAKAKIERLANQFVSASQREDASDMQPAMVKAFRELASSGAFDGIDAGVKGYSGDVKGFIDQQTSPSNALVRFVQGS